MWKFVSMTQIKISGQLVRTKTMLFWNAVDNFITSSRTIKYRGKKQKKLTDKIKFDLRNIVKKHMDKGSCSHPEAKFLLSKIESFSVPHFYIRWKILKNPIVGRPIVAGYNWILTPASIFVGSLLKDFYGKFDGILKDSLSLIKILEKTKFNNVT